METKPLLHRSSIERQTKPSCLLQLPTVILALSLTFLDNQSLSFLNLANKQCHKLVIEQEPRKTQFQMFYCVQQRWKFHRLLSRFFVFLLPILSTFLSVLYLDFLILGFPIIANVTITFSLILNGLSLVLLLIIYYTRNKHKREIRRNIAWKNRSCWSFQWHGLSDNCRIYPTILFTLFTFFLTKIWRDINLNLTVTSIKHLEMQSFDNNQSFTVPLLPISRLDLEKSTSLTLDNKEINITSPIFIFPNCSSSSSFFNISQDKIIIWNGNLSQCREFSLSSLWHYSDVIQKFEQNGAKAFLISASTIIIDIENENPPPHLCQLLAQLENFSYDLSYYNCSLIKKINIPIFFLHSNDFQTLINFFSFNHTRNLFDTLIMGRIFSITLSPDLYFHFPFLLLCCLVWMNDGDLKNTRFFIAGQNPPLTFRFQRKRWREKNN